MATIKKYLFVKPHAIPTMKDGKRPEIRSAALLQEMGNINRLQNRHEEASKLYEQGLAIARSTRDQNAIVDILVLSAQNQRGQLKYIGAAASLTEALTIFKKFGNDRGLADALRGLGNVQREQHKYPEAEASFREALAIYKRTKDDLGQAHT